MRENSPIQPALLEPWLELPRSKELQAIDDLLKHQPRIGELAVQDLIEGDRERGRPGMSGDEVVRLVILKTLLGLSYTELEFQLHDSQSCRTFLGYGPLTVPPARSTIAANIKRLSPETLRKINEEILGLARERGVEDGQKVRVDTTVMASNIHHPFESEQLGDVVRVLTRLMAQANELTGPAVLMQFSDRTRRAGRRRRAAFYAKNPKQRKSAYRDLLKVVDEVVGWATRIAGQLENWVAGDPRDQVKAIKLGTEILRVTDLARSLSDTAHRRVLNGETVPSTEKVLSIFEPHTDVIRKDNRQTLHGHKICLTGGVSSMILDCVVLEGNPADSTLTIEAISRQEELYGRLPRQAVFDGGFASKDNLLELKALGVDDVVFSKRRGLVIEDMTSDRRSYRLLKNFRAGIEGCISFLKRCLGFDRCPWRSQQSFRAYAQVSIISFNLLILARHLMA